MKVIVKEGVLDVDPYNEVGDIQDFSGLTGTCTKKDYESAVKDNDTILVSFDNRSLARLPQAYIDHAEKVDEDYTKYYFYKSDLEIVR